MSLRGLGFEAGETRRTGDARAEVAADGAELGGTGLDALEIAGNSGIVFCVSATASGVEGRAGGSRSARKVKGPTKSSMTTPTPTNHGRRVSAMWGPG
jgi:hypothetical protein